jgi:23S rRNA pseudouridine1911/1915/1917 synthase
MTRRLCDQFKDRTVDKRYWALVEGQVAPEHGTWRDTIRKIPDIACAEVVSATAPDGKSAVLHYRVLFTHQDSSLLEIRLETGRTHQIRVQASSRGHAIWGDEQYGSHRSFGPQTADPRDRWIALHARSIAWQHPKSRLQVSVVAPATIHWQQVGVAELDSS